MKKIIQKSTRAFSIKSLDNTSSKVRSNVSHRSSNAIENILFAEDDLMDRVKKTNAKKTSKKSSSQQKSDKTS
jgi:hypothetical protein